MDAIKFRLLGAPDIWVGGGSLHGAISNKDCALLYYLATTRTAHRRSLLAALLWGDYTDDSARGNLRKTLSMLHQTLGDRLQIDRDQVGLAAGAWTCDVGAFEQEARAALHSGDVHRLTSAAERYTGDFLAGFSVRNAPDFELWQAQVGERLRRLAMSVFLALAEQQMENGDCAAASATFEQALTIELWCEEAHRGKMIALARCGQRSAALYQYQQCVKQLAEELAVAPSAETQKIHAQIRSGALAPVAMSPTAANDMSAGSSDVGWHPVLPLQLSPIIGRESELAELGDLFTLPECRLINLIGPGGIGKTRLALTLAHLLTNQFPAAAMLALAGVQQNDVLLSTIESGLCLELPHGMEDAHAVAAAIGKRYPRLLLVLDNFEQLIPDGLPILAELLAGAPGLRCIVTSRQALNTTWEWRYLVQELAYPHAVDAPDVGTYDAVRLFLTIARRVRPRAAINALEMAQVARICQLVAGMPLGIELAAAQAGRIPLSTIVEMLARDLEHFETTLLDLPPRQRSLLATFESSWTELNAEEQRALAWLSPLHGEFTLDAALQITGATIPVLLQLIDRSLVRSHDADVYSLHEVIRRLAESKLQATPGAAEAAFVRYFNYYKTWGSTQDLQTLYKNSSLGHDMRAQLVSGLRHLRYCWSLTLDSTSTLDLSDSIALVQNLLRSIQLDKQPNTFDLMKSTSDSAEHAAALPEAVEPLDVIWLPNFVHRVLDLSAAFASERAQLLPVLQDACTFDSRLIAFPYMLEVALLYYRSDLLEEAGFSTPPRTWDDLELMAAEIQARQRADGQSDFWGYVWQGHPSEHMMGDFMEWLHSEGGGTIVEPDGSVSIDNPATVAALQRARHWIGVISPPNIQNYHESDVVGLWQNGQAAFSRLWSVGYPLRSRPVFHDHIGVTLMPSGSVRHAATLGGWPLAVRRESTDPQQAVRLIKQIASLTMQRQRVLHGQPTPPSLADLYKDPELLAHAPILGKILHLIDSGGLAIRPVKVTGVHYSQVSTATMKAVGSVLYDDIDAAEAMASLAKTLATVLEAAE